MILFQIKLASSRSVFSKEKILIKADLMLLTRGAPTRVANDTRVDDDDDDNSEDDFLAAADDDEVETVDGRDGLGVVTTAVGLNRTGVIAEVDEDEEDLGVTGSDGEDDSTSESLAI